MNCNGVHYIRTLPFAKRKSYGESIQAIHRLALVISTNAWYDTEFRCYIVHKDQTLRAFLHKIGFPTRNIAAFDAINKQLSLIHI